MLIGNILRRESDELGYELEKQAIKQIISDIGAAQSEIVFYCFYM